MFGALSQFADLLYRSFTLQRQMGPLLLARGFPPFELSSAGEGSERNFWGWKTKAAARLAARRIRSPRQSKAMPSLR